MVRDKIVFCCVGELSLMLEYVLLLHSFPQWNVEIFNTSRT